LAPLEVLARTSILDNSQRMNRDLRHLKTIINKTNFEGKDD